MMYWIKTTIFALFILLVLNIPAHSKGFPGKELFRAQSSHDSSHKKDYDPFLVKLNPAAVMYGEVPFYYEREIWPYVSIELGAGPTYRNFGEEFILLDNWINNRPPDQYILENTKGQLGILLKSAIRYYTDEDGQPFEGFYLNFSPNFETYNTILPQTGSAKISASEVVPCHSIYFDLTAGLGWQYKHESVYFDNYSYYFDFGFNIGYRFRHYELPMPDPFTDSYMASTFTNPIFVFAFNLKYGWGF